MTFTYPAVITPHKDDDGFHIVFPDLELCEGDGPDLEDALDDAREAAYNWLMVELEEGGEFPAQSHEEDIEVPEGGFVRWIIVRIKLLRTVTDTSGDKDQAVCGSLGCRSNYASA